MLLPYRGLKDIWRLDEEFNRAAKEVTGWTEGIRISISPVLIERCERKYGERSWKELSPISKGQG